MVEPDQSLMLPILRDLQDRMGAFGERMGRLEGQSSNIASRMGGTKVRMRGIEMHFGEFFRTTGQQDVALRELTRPVERIEAQMVEARG